MLRDEDTYNYVITCIHNKLIQLVYIYIYNILYIYICIS